jgi:hypothetical protein
MAAERALDIFWLLGQLDRKNHDVWEGLTEEQRKEVSPYVILRWLAGNVEEPEQLVNLADIAAPYAFEFGDEKDLMLKVFAACTVGGPKRYNWVNYKVTAKRKNRAVGLVAETYKWPLRHAAEALHMFTNEELLELAQLQGWQADEVKDLKKELAK